MDKKEEYVEIDLLKLCQALWRKAWAILLAMLILGGCACAFTAIFIKPLYKATTLLYVNNNSFSVGDTKLSISQGDLTAAQSLVDTYGVILMTRSTLEEVEEKAGVSYPYEDFVKMVKSSAVNGTEVFAVEVTSHDPAEAETVANTIGQVLPEKIASIVEGSSVRIVDAAVRPAKKASPSLLKNTFLGALAGFVLACGVVIAHELLDDKLHDGDSLSEALNIPVLAVIPDLEAPDKGTYYYKSGYEKAGKGGKRHE